MKKSLLISTVVAMVLIGCGGSNGGSCCGFTPNAEGEGVIVATTGGIVDSTKSTVTARDTATGDVTSSCECTSVKKDNKPACQPTTVEADKCKLSLIQKTTCQNSDGTLTLATLTAADIAAAKDHIAIDSATESISFGGFTTLTSLNGNVDEITGNFTFALPADMCGKNIDNPDKKLGFGGYHKESVSGDENKIYALITDADGTRWVEGTIVGGQVSFPGVHIKLDSNNEATVKVFRVTDLQGTGMTGSIG